MIHPEVLAGAAGLLAIERLTYVWISRQPRAFEAWTARMPVLSGTGPISSVRYLFNLFKVLQVAVFAWWCWVHGGGSPVSLAPHATAIGTGLALVAAGQYLNLRVFWLLGHDGVFYGNRFGVELPWRTEFPFSVLPHPQYAGTCLSIWGLFLLVRFPFPDWYALPLLETLYYAVGSWLES